MRTQERKREGRKERREEKEQTRSSIFSVLDPLPHGGLELINIGIMKTRDYYVNMVKTGINIGMRAFVCS